MPNLNAPIIPLNSLKGVENSAQYRKAQDKTVKRNERLEDFFVNLQILNDIPFIYDCIREHAETHSELSAGIEAMIELHKAYTRHTEAQYQVLFDEITHTQEEDA